MSATFTRSATAPASLTVQGVPLPEVCTVKQARALAKSLMGRATEASFIMSKTTPSALTAYAVGCALLGAADNQGAPLERLTALAGEKASKAVRGRLHVVAQATAAGRAAFKAGAESLSLSALFAGPALSDLTDAGQKAAQERAAADAARIAQDKANAAAAARTEKAVSDRLTDAAKAAALSLDREVADAYRAAHQHGASMDNGAADAEWAREVARRESARAADKAQADKVAWIEAKAADKVKDLTLSIDLAAAKFRALAERFGVVLTADQQAAIAAAVAEEVRALAPALAPDLAPAPVKIRKRKAA